MTPQATAVLSSGKTSAFRLDWLDAGPDALGFALGLVVAWYAGWTSGDLIWSLWLSSLVVGYATIVWMIGQPSFEWARYAWKERAEIRPNPHMIWGIWLLILFIGSFMLGFFTVHFGGFHYVQSQILLGFFPITLKDGSHELWATRATYLEIFRRYWIFLPSAFLSHRAVFLQKPFSLEPRPASSALMDQKRRKKIFTAPYANVIRMHGLIFFFFCAHFVGLENFFVYTVIYAAYFFPWRLVRRDA